MLLTAAVVVTASTDWLVLASTSASSLGLNTVTCVTKYNIQIIISKIICYFLVEKDQQIKHNNYWLLTHLTYVYHNFTLTETLIPKENKNSLK